MNATKVITGIQGLDRELKEGIDPGASILFNSEPGVENLEFAQQTAYTNLQNGKKCIYFVNNKKPEIVAELFEYYDWDIKPFIKTNKFIFIDGYSSWVGLTSNASFKISNAEDIKEIDKVITNCIKKYKDSIMIIDTLTNLIDTVDYKTLFKYIKSWNKNAKENKVTLLLLFTKWPYDEEILDDVKLNCDIVIDLKIIEQDIMLRKYFSIAKFFNERIEEKIIPFKIFSSGGVRVYIPKVLVTGPYHAGKSSFIHSASTTPVSVNRLGTTIALDFGHVNFKGFAVDLFGTPGQERFDSIIKLLGGKSFGVILIIDSTQPKTFARAKEMIEISKTTGLPMVVAANKSDFDNALKPEQIREEMVLTEDISIIPMKAENLKDVTAGKPCKLNKEDVKKVLEKIFQDIT